MMLRIFGSLPQCFLIVTCALCFRDVFTSSSTSNDRVQVEIHKHAESFVSKQIDGWDDVNVNADRAIQNNDDHEICHACDQAKSSSDPSFCGPNGCYIPKPWDDDAAMEGFAGPSNEESILTGTVFCLEEFRSLTRNPNICAYTS